MNKVMALYKPLQYQVMFQILMMKFHHVNLSRANEIKITNIKTRLTD